MENSTNFIFFIFETLPYHLALCIYKFQETEYADTNRSRDTRTVDVVGRLFGGTVRENTGLRLENKKNLFGTVGAKIKSEQNLQTSLQSRGPGAVPQHFRLD